MLIIGLHVKRDDGRFYIPVKRTPSIEGLSDIVLRVAGDAFPTMAEAEWFAEVIAMQYNQMAEDCHIGQRVQCIQSPSKLSDFGMIGRYYTVTEEEKSGVDRFYKLHESPLGDCWINAAKFRLPA